MTAAELLADCAAREIILTAQEDRLEIDAPEAELTPDLLARLQAHKPELLEILAPEPPAAGYDFRISESAPSILRIPLTPAERTERPADLQPQADAQPEADAPADLAAEWIERTGPDGRLIIERTDAGPGWDDAIDPPTPCDGCGGIVRWIDAAGGLHCPACSPPRTADRLRRLAAELRARYRPHAHVRDDAAKHPAAPAPWRLPPWPPVVPAEILADPVPECRECGRPRVIPGQPGRPVGLCYPCWLKESAGCENAPGTNAKAIR